MAVLRVCLSSLVDGGDGFPRHAYPTEGLASGPVVSDQSEEWGQCLGPAVRLGAGELPDGLVLAVQTAAGYGAAGARPTLGKGRSRRDLLGCSRTGVWGRQTESKALIVVAAEEDGRGIGGIRMQRIPDASADSLMPFVKESIQPGSMVHTDGWLGYERLESQDYRHQITFLRGHQRAPSELLPRLSTASSRCSNVGCWAHTKGR